MRKQRSGNNVYGVSSRGIRRIQRKRDDTIQRSRRGLTRMEKERLVSVALTTVLDQAMDTKFSIHSH